MPHTKHFKLIAALVRMERDGHTAIQELIKEGSSADAARLTTALKTIAAISERAMALK